MPVLSRFCGITIRMYFLAKEHNPPHIHAVYGDDAVAIAIGTGEILEGFLPPRQLALVVDWLAINKRELLEMWQTQRFKQLAPLE